MPRCDATSPRTPRRSEHIACTSNGLPRNLHAISMRAPRHLYANFGRFPRSASSRNPPIGACRPSYKFITVSTGETESHETSTMRNGHLGYRTHHVRNGVLLCEPLHSSQFSDISCRCGRFVTSLLPDLTSYEITSTL
eukprot:6201827-Pleurochrysis_carterae.AAC.4